MVRRIFAIVLIVLGLGAIGAAIASGTVWKPDERVTLTLPATPDVPVVTTAPGVLDVVDDHVDVRLVAADPQSPIVVAMARERDVDAWLQDAPHWQITGLADWETLAYTRVGGDPEPSASPTDSESDDAGEEAGADGEEAQTLPNPSGSDLWIEEVTGTGELTYSWESVPGRWVMLIATDGTEPAPQVEMTWDREVETPFVRPGIILGGVVLLLGLGLLILQILADIEGRRARRAAAAEAASQTSVITMADGSKPMTRREIRLAQQAENKRGGAAGRSVEQAAGLGAGDEADKTETIPAVQADDNVTTAAADTEGDKEADSVGDADELDAWVRSGAASPLLHEADRTSPDDLGLDADQDHDQPQEQEQEATAAPSEPKKRRWRSRRERRAAEASSTRSAEEAEQAPAEEAERAPQPAATPAEADADDVAPPTGHAEETDAAGTEPTDEPEAVDEGELDNPQATGASWRQAWGLGAAHDDEQEGPR